ncbi:MAG: hypothetical protein HC940_10660 [Acaryochloris sp. SU_5_25]|nr:hypothetical protein [Acaryochloris sp. SU_5_25]
MHCENVYQQQVPKQKARYSSKSVIERPAIRMVSGSEKHEVTDTQKSELVSHFHQNFSQIPLLDASLPILENKERDQIVCQMAMVNNPHLQGKANLLDARATKVEQREDTDVTPIQRSDKKITEKEKKKRKEQSLIDRNSRRLAQYDPSKAKNLEKKGGNLKEAVKGVGSNLAHGRGVQGSPQSGTTKNKMKLVNLNVSSTKEKNKSTEKQHANFYKSQAEKKEYDENKISGALQSIKTEAKDKEDYKERLKRRWPQMSDEQVERLAQEFDEEDVVDLLTEHEDVKKDNSKDNDDDKGNGGNDNTGLGNFTNLVSVY